MNLRTPRRRISPRTKRRYRAIKNFLRRALGNSSQPDIQINSSIAVNVTNLNRKIVHLEKQLNDVSRHLLSVESIPRKESDVSIPTVKDSTDAFKEQASLPRGGYASDTKVLYKTSQYRYKNDDIDSVMRLDLTDNENIKPGKICPHYHEFNDVKLKNNKNELRVIKESHPKLSNHKSKSMYENFTSAYSTSSYHSLVSPKNYQYIRQSDDSDLHYSRKHKKSPDLEKIMEHEYERDRKYKELKRKDKSEKHERNHVHQHGKKQKNRHISQELDSDYIANIIKRQYRPIKMFGRLESGVSQFSVPICRDQEYKLNENITQESELYSCFYDHTRPGNCSTNHDRVNDQRSICDTRLYSSKRHYKNNRKYINNYDDSTLYDLIPVKEKSSPKSRRKFEEDNIRSFEYYKEVPPSPKTLRPKLNLKVQHHTEIDEDTIDNKRRNRRRSHSRSKRRYNNSDHVLSTDSYEKIEQTSSQNPKKIKKTNVQQDIKAMNSQALIFNNKQTSIIHDTSLDKFQHTNTSDKTDKALSEIKDILETFLVEIKKESSNCGTSNVSNKSKEKYLPDHRQDTPKTNPDANINSVQNSYNNCGMEHCSLPPPYMSPYPSPYCYPILPICPINCMQNGYVLPSPSYTCATCANKEEYLPKNTNTTTGTNNNNETVQLIKEIYNFVRQPPKLDHDKGLKATKQQAAQKKLTSRSIGGSSVVSRHDAKVGTPKLKCYSKSCEAISSPVSDVYYNRTNPSYSDTILEKLSLEVTETESESEISSSTTIKKKNKANRFTKVLRSFGLLKKKTNNDAIEELSKSENTEEIDVKMNPPFKQEIKNYMMHGQEYFHPPPMPRQSPHCHNFHGHSFEHAQYHGASYSRYPDEIQPQIPQFNICSPRETHYAAHPSAPPYPNYLHKPHHMHPQVPLCLKEIEVKSMATQSDRKMSFFKKITKKMQPAPSNNYAPSPPKNSFTQTAYDKPGFWKTLQMKQQLQLEQQQQQRLTKQNKNLDPMNFSLKTQQQLAQGDMKMRNAMLKKLFHKRNPFSPRNLIVRTILGKDKSSFGEPPKMYRPRMFF